MLSAEQQHTAFVAAQVPLRFLVFNCWREQQRFVDLSDSAEFYRLWDLCWTMRDAEVAALLYDSEKSALVEFNQVFESLPWRIVKSHPHIRELPDDDFSPLIPVAKRLLQLFEIRK